MSRKLTRMVRQKRRICARQGFAIFLPRYLKQRRHAALEKIAASLFHGYLFLSIDLATQQWLSDRPSGGGPGARH
jgi:transcription termination factor NusG